MVVPCSTALCADAIAEKATAATAMQGEAAGTANRVSAAKEKILFRIRFMVAVLRVSGRLLWAGCRPKTVCFRKLLILFRLPNTWQRIFVVLGMEMLARRTLHYAISHYTPFSTHNIC